MGTLVGDILADFVATEWGLYFGRRFIQVRIGQVNLLYVLLQQKEHGYVHTHHGLFPVGQAVTTERYTLNSDILPTLIGFEKRKKYNITSSSQPVCVPPVDTGFSEWKGLRRGPKYAKYRLGTLCTS